MLDITIVNGDYFMVYTPTFTSLGGPMLVESTAISGHGPLFVESPETYLQCRLTRPGKRLNITNRKDPRFLMGKSTISTGPCSIATVCLFTRGYISQMLDVWYI